MGGNYGNNILATNPNYDVQKPGFLENSIAVKERTSEFNNKGNKNFNCVIISQPENRIGRNDLIEDLKSSKSQSNHSPLLTKRK